MKVQRSATVGGLIGQNGNLNRGETELHATAQLPIGAAQPAVVFQEKMADAFTDFRLKLGVNKARTLPSFFTNSYLPLSGITVT